MKRQDKEAKELYLKKLELIRSSSSANALETELERNEAIQRAKKDINYCVKRYFPHYATSESAPFQISFANKVKKERTIKAFAQWGRGLAKSVWCDVYLPFWLWLNNEAHYVVLVAQNADKAAQLLGDLQAELEANPQIISDYGEQKTDGSWEYGDFKARGCRKHNIPPLICKAAGIGQSVRGLRIGGQRPDLCIVDDIETRETARNPKRQDEYVKWVKEDLVPTMDGPIRRLLYANNRFAERMIQTELQKQQPNWHVSHVPAYNTATYEPAWKEKYSNTYYKDLEGEIGVLSCHAEYAQIPQKAGKIFKPEMISWAKIPQLRSFQIIVGHWDIAYTDNEKSDFNAIKIWGLKEQLFYYIQGFVKQCKLHVAIQYMFDVQKCLPPGVIIHWQFEAQFWNDEIYRTLKEKEIENGFSLAISKIDTPRGKKYDRILSEYPKYQNNRIRYNKDMQADKDTIVGLDQLYGIEPGYNTHDDSPDADEQCLKFLEKHVVYGVAEDSKFRVGKMKPKNERI